MATLWPPATPYSRENTPHFYYQSYGSSRVNLGIFKQWEGRLYFWGKKLASHLHEGEVEGEMQSWVWGPHGEENISRNHWRRKDTQPSSTKARILQICKTRTIYPLWLTRDNKARETEYNPSNILMCERSCSNGLGCKQRKLCQEFMCHMKPVTSRAPKTKKEDGKEKA